MKGSQFQHVFFLFAVYVALTLLSACGNSKENALSGTSSIPFDQSNGGLYDYPDLGGSLSTTDQTALNNVATESAAATTPEIESTQLPADIQQAVKQISTLQSQNLSPEQQAQLAAQKFQVAGALLQSCARQIADYAPQPGEPLQGNWQGNGATFTILGQFARTVNSPKHGQVGLGAARFIVSGNLFGQAIVQANPNGIAQFTSGAYSGALTDVPQAGNGYLFRNGSKTHDVRLVSTKNLFPVKYVDAMRRAGRCYMQAAFLMSPVADRLFRGMNPQLAQILRQRVLGLP